MQMSLSFLKKAESLSKNIQRLKAITCNNLACYYSKDKKVRSASNFLESALSIEYNLLKNCRDDSQFESILLTNNPSDAHLNLCVSLSNLGKHDEALQNGLQALVFIQNEIIERSLGSSGNNDKKKQENSKDHEKNNEKDSEKKVENEEEKSKNENNSLKPLSNRYEVMCIAYHNVAAQYEFLRMVFVYLIQDDMAQMYYKKAKTFGNSFLGPAHPITKNMDEVCKSTEEKLKEKKKKGRNNEVDPQFTYYYSLNEILKKTDKDELNMMRTTLKVQYFKSLKKSKPNKGKKNKKHCNVERLMTPRENV